MTDAAFWNRIARRYAAKPIADMTNYERTLARVVSHLSPTDHVLELGGGTGTTALRLGPSVARYRGTDVSPEMIAIARENLAAEPVPGVAFDVATARLDGMAAGEWDAVLAFNLYHLVGDLPGAFARVHDVLKPGGLFITKTPCLARMWYLAPVIGAMRLVGMAPRVTYFGTEGLDRMIRAAGFEIVETGFYPKPSRFVVARKV